MGRPAKFKTVTELDCVIDRYFESLKYIDENNQERMAQPGIAELAYELGFCSRQSIYDYKGKEDFSYSIKRALLFIESWHEKNSCGRNPTGSIFIMKNMGWKDKTEVDNTHNFAGPAKISFGNNSTKGCK